MLSIFVHKACKNKHGTYSKKTSICIPCIVLEKGVLIVVAGLGVIVKKPVCVSPGMSISNLECRLATSLCGVSVMLG